MASAIGVEWLVWVLGKVFTSLGMWVTIVHDSLVSKEVMKNKYSNG